MAKKHKITVLEVPFELEVWEMEKLLTDSAMQLARKIIRQGGELSFGIKSVKPELLQQS